MLNFGFLRSSRLLLIPQSNLGMAAERRGSSSPFWGATTTPSITFQGLAISAPR